MITRKSAPTKNYSKIDNSIWTNPNLSSGAVRLYGYLSSLRIGANFTDSYIIAAMGISKRSLIRSRKELKDARLIAVDQVSARLYVIYIGHSVFSAEEVRQHWINMEDDTL